MIFFTISKAFHKHKHTRITVYFFIQKLKISFSSLVLYLILFYSSHLNVKLIKYLWTISHRLYTNHWCLLCWHLVPSLSTSALSSLITGSLARCMWTRSWAEQQNMAGLDGKMFVFRILSQYLCLEIIPNGFPLFRINLICATGFCIIYMQSPKKARKKYTMKWWMEIEILFQFIWLSNQKAKLRDFHNMHSSTCTVPIVSSISDSSLIDWLYLFITEFSWNMNSPASHS